MRLYTHSFLALFFSLYSLPIFSACQFKPKNLNYFPLIQSFIVNPTAPASPYFTSFKDIYLKFGKQTILQPNENINEWYAQKPWPCSGRFRRLRRRCLHHCRQKQPWYGIATPTPAHCVTT